MNSGEIAVMLYRHSSMGACDVIAGCGFRWHNVMRFIIKMMDTGTVL